MSDARGSILGVADADTNCDLLARRLRRQAYGVRVATSGVPALELIAHDPVDLVLLDLNMPETDGFQVLTEIRRRVAKGYLQRPLVTARLLCS
jgi:adenylate cyclase